jgi:hypothetical protein
LFGVRYSLGGCPRIGVAAKKVQNRVSIRTDLTRILPIFEENRGEFWPILGIFCQGSILGQPPRSVSENSVFLTMCFISFKNFSPIWRSWAEIKCQSNIGIWVWLILGHFGSFLALFLPFFPPFSRNFRLQGIVGHWQRTWRSFSSCEQYT